MLQHDVRADLLDWFVCLNECFSTWSRWSTWNFYWSTSSSINPWTKTEHALEFTDLCAIQFRLVIHEVSV